jgi:TetR/AcrR family transcriptional regulator
MSNTKTRDGEATKRIIIKTACKLFSEKGFNGVSIRDLANACGLSGPLILHHFKNKDGVYDAVRLSLIEKYIPLFENNYTDKDDLFKFIENVVRAAFAFHRENPIAFRLMNWDRLNVMRKPWPKTEEFERMFTERLQKAMDSGEVKSNFSAKYFGIMIGGMIHLWWENHDYIMNELPGDKRNKAAVLKADEEYLQQILLFVRNNLKI